MYHLPIFFHRSPTPPFRSKLLYPTPERLDIRTEYTEFRIGTSTAAQCRSPTPCSGSGSCFCFADSGFRYRRPHSIPTLGLWLW